MAQLKNKSVTYSIEIEVEKTPSVIFSHLVDLAKWWPEDFKGAQLSQNSEFIFTTGPGHYSKNKVVEFIPGKILVWQALESIRKSDDFDWSGTKFIFEITPAGKSTKVKFTYDGVVLENESKKLRDICDMTLKEMFYDYIVNGKAKAE